MTADPINQPIVAGSAVILTGESVEAALQAVLIAARARTRNGLPNSAAHLELAKAFAEAMSANASARGRSVIDKAELLQAITEQERLTVTIEDAARQLALSERQVRRLAPKLNGRKINGQWLIDQDAIDEHKEGMRWTATA
jgi:hypothetical protein